MAQDCTVMEDDCGTLMGVEVESLLEGGEVIQTLGERILGRVVQAPVIDPYKNTLLADKGMELDEKLVEKN